MVTVLKALQVCFYKQLVDMISKIAVYRDVK